MTDLTDEDLLQALDRIARTPDGALLYLYFQRITMETLWDTNASDGALRSHDARRRFATELMARMAKGMDESSGSTSAGHTTARPVIFRTGKPVAVSRHVSARKQFGADIAELRTLHVNKSGGDGA